MENDPDYQKIYHEVENNIHRKDKELAQQGKLPQNCSLEQLKVFNLKPKEFESEINIKLPKINKKDDTIYFDVNSYNQLSKNYLNKTQLLEHDHIPSFSALNIYLKNHGLEPIENRVKQNSSTISIPEKYHLEWSRTYSGRNFQKINDEAKNIFDSKHLFLATIKDISAMAWHIQKNGNSGEMKTYLIHSMTIYIRNKLLCIYDI